MNLQYCPQRLIYSMVRLFFEFVTRETAEIELNFLQLSTFFIKKLFIQAFKRLSDIKYHFFIIILYIWHFSI